MPGKVELVPVTRLHVLCALKVRCLNQPGYAASDACGSPAGYAVEMPSGSRLYRCTEHRNVRWLEADQGTARAYPGESRTGPTYTLVAHRTS